VGVVYIVIMVAVWLGWICALFVLGRRIVDSGATTLARA
jgi:hypothetical protein